MLRELVMQQGEVKIWVDSHMVWKEKTVSNLVAVVEGSDPLLKNEVVIISAYYDESFWRIGGFGDGKIGFPIVESSTDELEKGLYSTKIEIGSRQYKYWVLLHSFSPPPSTVAELASDYSLIMPKSASERRGIQPVIIRITANGQSGGAKVPLGKPVEFNGVAEAPLGT